MAKRETRWSGTVSSGSTETIPLSMMFYDDGFQVSVEGAGTVAITTQEAGNAAYVDQTDLTEGSLIFDMQKVANLQLTASGGDMDYVVTIRGQYVSSQTDNFMNFPAGG